jgi:hypothetical protein
MSNGKFDKTVYLYPILGQLKREDSQDEKKPLMPRSLSVESSSSGHGGSSAMSSAEGLGTIGEFCQIHIPNIDHKHTPSNDSKTP